MKVWSFQMWKTYTLLELYTTPLFAVPVPSGVSARPFAAAEIVVFSAY